VLIRALAVSLLAAVALAAGAVPDARSATMDLEVVVVDEEGRPWERAMVLAGAVVQWRLRAGGCSGDSSQGGALTDGGGKVRFALELEDAEWVRVAASVWVEEGNEWDTGPGPQ
jgi:hypothetical protein